MQTNKYILSGALRQRGWESILFPNRKRVDKITDGDKKEIVSLYESGTPIELLMRKFNRSSGSIRQVLYKAAVPMRYPVVHFAGDRIGKVLLTGKVRESATHRYAICRCASCYSLLGEHSIAELLGGKELVCKEH